MAGQGILLLEFLLLQVDKVCVNSTAHLIVFLGDEQCVSQLLESLICLADVGTKLSVALSQATELLGKLNVFVTRFIVQALEVVDLIQEFDNDVLDSCELALALDESGLLGMQVV